MFRRFVVYLSTVGSQGTAEEDLAPALEALLAQATAAGASPRVLFRAYYRQLLPSGGEPPTPLPEGLVVCPPPDASLDMDGAVEQARRLGRALQLPDADGYLGLLRPEAKGSGADSDDEDIKSLEEVIGRL